LSSSDLNSDGKLQRSEWVAYLARECNREPGLLLDVIRNTVGFWQIKEWMERQRILKMSTAARLQFVFDFLVSDGTVAFEPAAAAEIDRVTYAQRQALFFLFPAGAKWHAAFPSVDEKETLSRAQCTAFLTAKVAALQQRGDDVLLAAFWDKVVSSLTKDVY
jgi:hypothetical protein